MTKVIEEDSFHEVHLVVIFQENIRELTEKKFIDDSNVQGHPGGCYKRD